MNDMEPRVPLDTLDPGRRDAGYWGRFHDAVMRRAAPRLALRAGGGLLTIETVLLSWSRMVVPAAVAAAAMVGFLLLGRASLPEPFLIGVEDLLREEVERFEVPALFTTGGAVDREAILFAVEGDPGGGP